jgi:AraC-like DNA-binding protein
VPSKRRHDDVTTVATSSDGPLRVAESLLIHLRRAKDLADRSYAEPIDLDGLARSAGVSKFHFLRSFAAAYGKTPAVYVTERRIERAQDLLRATNLTVTEVCMLVGYSSLGSFSTKFRQLVGVTPSAYQAEFAAVGVPHIPGCYVFMHGLSDRRADSAIREKHPVGDPS